MPTYKATFTRTMNEKASDNRIIQYVREMTIGALSGPKGNGWQSEIEHKSTKQNGDGHWVYVLTAEFQTEKKQESADKQWSLIVQYLVNAGRKQRFNKFPFYISGPQVEAIANSVAKIIEAPKPVYEPVDITDLKVHGGKHLSHIYGRDHHIKVIQSVVRAATESKMENRFHTMLYGPPGCGKTDLLESICSGLGEQNKVWLKLDAPSTTMAGAQKLLLQTDFIPPIWIIEEIEKVNENALTYLLSVLDKRSEVNKLNFRESNTRKVKVLVLATANNKALFSQMLHGALDSRFCTQLYCPRPNREEIELILNREVDKVKGKKAWIKPALEFCVDEQGWNDPRKIIPVCICGGDDLLSEKYQRSLRAIMKHETDDKDKERG